MTVTRQQAIERVRLYLGGVDGNDEMVNACVDEAERVVRTNTNRWHAVEYTSTPEYELIPLGLFDAWVHIAVTLYRYRTAIIADEAEAEADNSGDITGIDASKVKSVSIGDTSVTVGASLTDEQKKTNRDRAAAMLDEVVFSYRLLFQRFTLPY